MSGRRSRCLVVGYDATASSERALSWALTRAGHGGRVVVVHAARRQPDRLRAVPDVQGPARLAHARAVAERTFRERHEIHDAEHCDFEIRDLTPADALIGVADQIAADEIVIGARRGDRVRSNGGSVCSDLLARSDRPVVVIP